MELTTFNAAEPVQAFPDNIPHLSGPGAAIRQVLAAHFVRDCPHIVEIGGHLQAGHRLSDACAAVRAFGRSEDAASRRRTSCTAGRAGCAMSRAKFQEVEYDYAPGSYGLVLLGYSLKAFGSREPLGQLLFGLIDNAKTVILEYPPALERASSQVPSILSRPSLAMLCSLDITIDDAEIAGSPYARRRFHVLRARSAEILIHAMDRSLARYIWKHTWRHQVWILFIVAVSMIPYFMSFDLPKQIVNGPIQGKGFEQPGATQITLKSHIDYGVFYPIQKAAEMALTSNLSLLSDQVKEYESRRDALISGLADGGWHVPKTSATMFIWAQIPAGWKSRDFSYALIEKAGVTVVPGDAFGKQGEGYVRMALVQPVERLTEAAERIRWFLKGN